VDQEMVALAENQILYEAATQMLNKKLGLLKYVAQDGR
jgi:flagellar basal-body rod protein FlgB